MLTKTEVYQHILFLSPVIKYNPQTTSFALRLYVGPAGEMNLIWKKKSGFLCFLRVAHKKLWFHKFILPS